jgi:hypothetical protein
MNSNGFSGKNRRGCVGLPCLEVRVSCNGGSAIGVAKLLGYAGLSGGRYVNALRWEVNDMVKKILTWGGIAFVIYYLVTSPQGAANVVTGALDWLKNAGNSLGAFLNHIKL